MLAYCYDEPLHKTLNQQGLNYWDAYLEAILGQLGVTAEPRSLADLEDGRRLKDLRVFIIGAMAGRKLSDRAKANLTDWVSAGGLLIGFNVLGLDAVFGHTLISRVGQYPDDYAQAGYLNLRHHAVTHEVHPLIFTDQKLPIISELCLVKPQTAETLANLFAYDHTAFGTPAITTNARGRGGAAYFAFDLAKTIWLLHQGRPLPPDSTRITPAMSLIGHNSRKVPYADELVMVLQNLIAQAYPQPMIHALPPQGQTIPDALLYWGGDCCAGDSALFVQVSDWMKAQGLPYHINVFPRDGQLNLEPADAEHIRRNGHEISLHYRFDNAASPLTAGGVQAQAEMFAARYGFKPACSVVHGMTWKGWTEPAEWMATAGGLADNSFGNIGYPPAHAFDANGSCFGFGFGTAYPFFFYTDYRQGNRRLDFLEEPIVCYELGHRGSLPPYNDKTTAAPDETRMPMDLAVKYHFLMNMFYHPVYIGDYPTCRQAISALLAYIKERGYAVRHMAPNQVAEWWRARSRSRIDALQIQPAAIQFECHSDYPDGVVVKVPIQSRAVKAVTVNGGRPVSAVKHEFGQTWLLMIVPAGDAAVRVEFGS